MVDHLDYSLKVEYLKTLINQTNSINKQNQSSYLNMTYKNNLNDMIYISNQIQLTQSSTIELNEDPSKKQDKPIQRINSLRNKCFLFSCSKCKKKFEDPSDYKLTTGKCKGCVFHFSVKCSTCKFYNKKRLFM